MSLRSAVVLIAGLVTAVALGGCGTRSAIPPGAGPAKGGGRPSSAAAGGTASAYDVAPLVDPASGKYLGVEPSGRPGDLTPVKAFAASVGRRPNIIGAYVAWGEPFDAVAVTHDWSYGALYYMAWEPWHASLRSIAAGRYDAYISGFARSVRALNLPVAISFGHEMNGSWYPWGHGRASAAAFVAAWRHIHDLFVAAGAANVIWVWNPNVINPVPQVRLKPYYPGNSYVDWIGITGYFATTGPRTYATLYQPTIAEVRRFARKPFIIAETSIETGPAETQAAHALVAGVTRHRDLLGFVWFDYAKAGVDWRVESRPLVRAALAQGVADLLLVRVR